MNNTIVDSTVIFNSDINHASNGQVVRRKNPVSLFLSSAVLAVGLVLLIVAGQMGDRTTSVYIASLVFGVSGVLAGGLLLLFGGRQFIYTPTKSKVTLHSYFFEPNQFHTVCQAVKSGDCTTLKSLKRSDNSGIRLDVLSSADHRFAAAQVYHYVPYTYTPASQLYCSYDDRAQELIRVFIE